MFKRGTLNNLEDFFVDFAHRGEMKTYCCRLTAYNEVVADFLNRYVAEVKRGGLYIKGKLQNPDENQLAYYEKIMGLDFQMNMDFIDDGLKKWLPRLNMMQRRDIAEALLTVLNELAKIGKTENMLKNTFIKFFCWFYYKFEGVLNQLGKERLPKVLYEGDITAYELKALSILAKAGCDILILLPQGGKQYAVVDPANEYTQLIEAGNAPFPSDFSVASLKPKTAEKVSTPRANTVLSTSAATVPPNNQTGKSAKKPQTVVGSFRMPVLSRNPATNTWLTGDVLEDCLKKPEKRGTENDRFFYNLFVKLQGAEDKATYLNSLFKWKLKLMADNRHLLLIENIIPMPEPGAVSKITRTNSQNQMEILQNLAAQISFFQNKELENCAKVAFFAVFEDLITLAPQKLTNHGICVVCWLNRYLPKLFLSDKEMPVFLYYGACKTQNEMLFLRLIARMPADILVVNPDLNQTDQLQDKLLYVKNYADSMQASGFPTDIDSVQFGTVAYHAEQDLNTLMYEDTGMYRNRQFKKAIPISLQTIYEEIKILWNQEAKYRPGFEVLADRVMLPVIYSKISGVNGSRESYFSEIADLMGENSFLISELPYIKPTDQNPMKNHAVSFVKGGKLLADKWKNHGSFPYSYIREDMQDYMLDKLQELINRKIIKGTGSNGVEYTIFAVAMNLDKQIVRLIQKFDFTKIVPKLLVVHTNENVCSLEDSILVAYLNLLGFDIAVFVPTGYQTIERNFEQNRMAEHQLGEYMYDLRVPSFDSVKTQAAGFASRLFRRGR